MAEFDSTQSRAIDVPTVDGNPSAAETTQAPSTSFDFTPNLNYSNPIDDLHTAINPGLVYLKNALADSAKQDQVIKNMFAPDNRTLNHDQYVQKVNQDSIGPTVQAAMQNTAELSDADFYDRLNKLRALNGQMPIQPDQAQVQQPNNLQAIATFLGMLADPSHAMDTAAVPFQYGLHERDRQQALNNQVFGQKLAQWQNQMALEEQANQALNNRDVLRYQVSNQKQESAIDRNFRSILQKAGFDHDLNMQSLQFKQQFDLANLDQKQRMAMTLLHTVESGDPAQAPWAKTMLEGMGYNVPAMTGKPLSVQAQEVQIQTQRNEEERRGKLFPAQLQAAQNQANLLGKEVKWYDRLKSVDYRRGLAEIENIHSIIGDRTFQQGAELRSEDRQNIAQASTIVEKGLNAVQSQIKSIEDDINATQKALTTAPPGTDTTELKDRLERLKRDKTNAAETLQGMTTDYNAVKGQIFGTAGIEHGPTDLGAAFDGVPYSWGGGGAGGPTKGLGRGANTTGFDCSGLTCAVAAQDYGVSIPRTAHAQFDALQAVDPKDAQTGDFLYWSKGNEWHTGILVFKDGVPYVRQAPQTGGVVGLTELSKFKTSKTFMGVRRAWKPKANNNSWPFNFNFGDSGPGGD